MARPDISKMAASVAFFGAVISHLCATLAMAKTVTMNIDSFCPPTTSLYGQSWPTRYHQHDCILEPVRNASRAAMASGVGGLIDLNLAVMSGYAGGLGDIMTKAEPILRMAAQEIEDSGLLPGYRLKLFLADTFCTPQDATAQTMRVFTKGPYKHGLIGGSCSPACYPMNDMSQMLKVLHISPGCTAIELEDRPRYPYLVRFSPSIRYNTEPSYPIFKSLNWKRVGILYEDLAITQGVSKVFLDRVSKEVKDGTYPWIVLFFEKYSTPADATRLIRMVKQADARVLATAFYENKVSVLFCEAHNQGLKAPDVVWSCLTGWWSGDFLLSIEGFVADAVKTYGGTPCKPAQMLEAGYGAILFDRSPMQDTSELHGRSRRKLSDITSEYTSECMSFAGGKGACHFGFSGYFYDSVWQWAWLMHQYLIVDGKNLSQVRTDASREYLYQKELETDFQGVTGRVRHFNSKTLIPAVPADGDRDGSIVVKQLTSESSQTIVALFSSSGGFEWRADLVWNLKDATQRVPCAGASCTPAAGWAPADSNSTCTAGQIYDRRRGCVRCDLGEFAAFGATICEQCGEGRFSNSTGQSACHACARGLISRRTRATSCEACPEGTFTSVEGLTRCELCPRGTFSGSSQASSCTECSGAKTTMNLGSTSPSQCACSPGSLTTAHDKCVECNTDAMSCPGYGLRNISSRPLFSLRLDTDKITKIDDTESYYVLPRAFACLHQSDCPGAMPPNRCPRGHSGIACAECEKGFGRAGTRCESCDEGAAKRAAGGVVSVLFIILFSALVVKVVSVPAQRYVTTTMSLASTCGVFLSYLQLTGLLEGISIEWPDFLSSILTVLSVLNFDLGFLGTDCMVGRRSYSFDMLLKPLIVLVVCGLMTFFWFLGRTVPEKIIHRIRLLARRPGKPPLINSCGFLLNIAFVPVSMNGFSVVNCYRHPVEGFSMKRMPAVLCFEDLWTQEVLPAAMVSFLLTILIFSIFTFLAWRSPKIGKASQKLTFLLARFRPEAYMWNSAMLTRNLCLSFLPCLSNNSYLVVFLMTVCCVTYCGALARYTPWRNPVHNVADLSTIICLAATLNCGAVFSRSSAYKDSDQQDDVTWKVLRAATIGPVFIALLSLAGVFAHGFRYSRIDQQNARFEEVLPFLVRSSWRFSALVDSNGNLRPEALVLLKKNQINLSFYDMDAIVKGCQVVTDLLLGDVQFGSGSLGSRSGSRSQSRKRNRVNQVEVTAIKLLPNAQLSTTEAAVSCVEQV